MKVFLLTPFFYTTLAFAEGAPAGMSGLGPMVPLLLMFLIVYFLMIRPQQKKQKQHQQFLTALKKGDRVVTNAGIIGTIKTLSEQLVTIEVDDGVCIKFLRNQVLESANNLKPSKA